MRTRRPLLLVATLIGSALAARAELPRTIRVSAISMIWRDDARTLPNALQCLDQAGHDGADLALLPMECVLTPGEPIPGPISTALAA